MHFCTSSLRTLLFFGFLIISIASCSKKQRDPSISLDFSSQGNTALSVSISNIFVNLTGSAGKEVHQWDCEQGECGADFKLKFQSKFRGQTLIQVLVVADTATSVTTLNYGDKMVDLKPGDNPHQIDIEEKGNFNSEGRVSGRYIPSATIPQVAGKKLTGELAMSVSVGADKPDMLLMKQEIFGGWVRLMVLDTVGFKYQFTGHDQDGNLYQKVPVLQDLHDANGLRLSSVGLQPFSDERVLYDLGSNIYSERNGDFQQRPFDKKIVGFFGDNSGTNHRNLCSEIFDDGVYLDGQAGRSRVCKGLDVNDGSCNSYFTWGEIRADSVASGVDGQSDTCVGGADEVPVHLQNVGSGDRGILAFAGPFVSDPSFGEGLVDISVSAVPPMGTLAWKIGSDVHLPGDVAVFFSADVSDFDRHDIETNGGIYDCGRLPNHFVRQVPNVAANPGNISSLAIPSQFLSSDMGFALCPLKPNGEFYGSALVTDKHNGDPSGPPTQIHFVKDVSIDGGTGALNHDACVPFSIELHDSQGNLAHADSAVTVDIDDDEAGAGIEFFGDYSDCVTDNEAAASFSLHDRLTIFAKAYPLAGTNTFNLLAEDNGGVLNSSTFSVNTQSDPGVDHWKLVASFDRADELEIANTEACVAFYIAAMDSNNELVSFNGSDSFDASLPTHNPSSAPVTLYDDAYCDNAISSVTTPTDSDSLFVVSFQSNPSFADGTSIEDILGGCSGACNNDPIAVVAPGSFNHFQPEVFGDMDAGACVPIKITAFDDHKPNSYPTDFPQDGAVIGYTNNSDDGGLLIDDSLNFGGSAPDGFECDDVAEADLILPSTHTDLGVVPTSGNPYRLVFYYPNAVGNNVDLDFIYKGETKSVLANVGAPSRGYIEVPVTHRPYLDYGTVELANFPATHNLSFVNSGGTNLSSITLNDLNGDFTNGSGTCGTTLNVGISCHMDFTFNSGPLMSLSLRHHWRYDNGGSGFRKSPVFVKGTRAP